MNSFLIRQALYKRIDYKVFKPGLRFAVLLSLLTPDIFSSDFGVFSLLPSVFVELTLDGSFPRLVTFLILALSQGDFFLCVCCFCCSSSGLDEFWSLAGNGNDMMIIMIMVMIISDDDVD